MAATMMIASGIIKGGSLTMKIALAPIQSKERQADILAAMEQGRYLYESGFSRSACRNQDELAGWDEADADCAAALEPLQTYPYRHALEGTSIDNIDYESELQELRDGMEEESWLRSWH